MSSKKKGSKKVDADDASMAKEQDEIARFVRFNCPTSTTLFEGNEVHYFSGSKAVDTLYDSKYGSKAKENPKFANRQAAVLYMQELMNFRLFFRAKKLVPKKKEDKKEKARAEAKSKKTKEDETVTETESEEKEKENKAEKAENKETEDEEKKKKKKVKLEVHDIQVFNDDKDVYVWVFDPTPLYKKVIGLLMVLGTIVGCLFPLWPMWLRQAIYYLSLAGIGAFGLIVVTAILRTILFGIIWLCTMGQHKLWILPNLTEDCGFFESFKPWYTYEYCPKDAKKELKKKKKKEKDSDDEKETSKPVKVEEEKPEKNVPEDGSGDVVTNENLSGEEEGTASSSEDVSAPSTPSEQQVKKRRPRRVDDGFVHVEKS